MNLILSIVILILLFVYVEYLLEGFTTTSVAKETDATDSQTTSVASQTTSVENLPSQKYFELNNQAKNLVNSYKYETQLKEISNEEQEMRNNVRKIALHAENVLDFTDLNKEYLEKIQLQHSESE